MSFFPELSELCPEDLQHAFADRNRADAQGEEADLWLDEVAMQIAQSGDAGRMFLLSFIPHADECRLRALLVGLSSIRTKLSAARRNEICDMARQFLEDTRPLIIAWAVEILNHLCCNDAREEVLELLHHPSPFVVGSVLRYMSRRFPREAVPLLEQALASADPIIRQNGIDELDELRWVQALPAIKRLVKDKDPDVRQAARTAVKNLEEIG